MQFACNLQGLQMGLCTQWDGVIAKEAGGAMNTEVCGNDALASHLMSAGFESPRDHVATKRGKDFEDLSNCGIELSVCKGGLGWSRRCSIRASVTAGSLQKWEDLLCLFADLCLSCQILEDLVVYGNKNTLAYKNSVYGTKKEGTTQLTTTLLGRADEVGKGFSAAWHHHELDGVTIDRGRGTFRACEYLVTKARRAGDVLTANSSIHTVDAALVPAAATTARERGKAGTAAIRLAALCELRHEFGLHRDAVKCALGVMHAVL
ncbi:hypothetical protein C8R46DRAFT_1035130 [Mycena filopes]|nr:hypothetical protein C8R46DRAFT_1035130 [Mycena filopes]